MARRNNARRYLLALVAILHHSLSQGANEPPQPSVSDSNARCHRLTYTDTIYSKDAAYKDEASASNYEPYKKAIKHAFVCIGDVLEIKDPLLSNGGDVILLADRIVLKAPIDTRIYFNHSSFRFIESVADGRRRPPVAKWVNRDIAEAHFKDGNGRKHDERFVKLYRNYYTNLAGCVKRGDDLYRPALLPGLVPAKGVTGRGLPGPQNGLPPPEPSWETATSGNVYLFARTVEFSSVPAPTPGCDLDRPGQIMINTGGVKGADGGAGHPSPCTGWSTARFDCTSDLYTMAGGLNAPGGRGGDAGNIVATVIDPGSLDRQRLSVAGGDPASNLKLRTPSGRGRNAIRTGELADFFPSPENWPISSAGRAGRVMVEQAASATDLLSGFVRRVRELELAHEYDFGELAERAEHNGSITSIDFEEFFERSLERFLQQAQLGLLDQVTLRLSRQPGSDAELVSPLFRSLDMRALAQQMLFTSSYRLVGELTLFERVGNHAITDSYLLSSGGLLNVFNLDSYNSLLANSGNLQQTDFAEALLRIRSELSRLNETALRTLVVTEGQRVDAQLERLRSALERAISATNEPNMLEKLSRVAKAAGAFYGQLVSGNYLGAALSLRELVSSMRASLVAYDESAAPDLLRQAMADILAAYDEFVVVAARAQHDALHRTAISLQHALRARTRGAAGIEFAEMQFHDLLRLAIFTYTQDPARSELQLQGNLVSLANLLTGYPSIRAGFRFRDVATKCGRETTDSNCIDVAADMTWRLMRAKDVGSPLDGVPLYVLAPSGSPLKLPLFGFQANAPETFTPPNSWRLLRAAEFRSSLAPR